MAEPLTDIFLYGQIADISTADQIYIPCPDSGEVIKIWSAIDAAITVGDATLTSKIGGTAITGGAITITQSGSAAGDVDSATPTASNAIQAGEAIEIETNGGSTTTSKANICVQVRRAYK